MGIWYVYSLLLVLSNRSTVMNPVLNMLVWSMVSRTVIQLAGRTRIYRGVVNGIQAEDGSDGSFIITLQTMDGTDNTAHKIYVRLQNWGVVGPLGMMEYPR